MKPVGQESEQSVGRFYRVAQKKKTTEREGGGFFFLGYPVGAECYAAKIKVLT